MEDIEWEDVAIGKSQRAVEGYTGNIDLASRPIYINDDGSISTEVSTTLEINGKHVILPTIRTENGQRVDMTPREAGDWYIKTGEHLGIFDDADEAEIMAQKIHTRFEPETDDIEWEDAKPVTQSVMDDRDGQVYNVPLAYDGVDTRFAIDTQHKGADKGSFFGKVFMDVSKMTTALTTSNMLSKMLPDNISFEGAKDLARGLVGSVEGFVDNKLVEATDLRQKQRIAAGKTYQMSAGDPLRDMAFDWEMPTEEEQEEAKKLVETAQKIRDANKKWWNDTKEAIKPEETMDEADKFIEALGGGLGSMGFSIGSMLPFKSATVGAAIIASEYGKMAGNQFFDEAVKNGMDFDMAYTLALGRGGIEGGIELVADTTLAKIANLKAIQDISNRIISSGLIKAAQSKLGKSAMQKIGTRHANSVFGAAIKGFGSEAGTEGLQQSLGMFYDNAAGIADYSLDQILGETLFASVIGGITGGLGAGGGTLAYNRQVVDTNERIKKVLQEQTPDLTAEETQTMADALQEMLYQESTGYMNELNNVMEKELAPDARQEGLTPEQLTAETRKLLKEKYQMNDVDIDKTIKSALSVIDARNQFNEAYTIFNEGLTNAGRDAARADGEARILAARALAVARAERVQVKDVLDRWNLQFRQTAWNEGDIDGSLEQAMYRSPLKTFGEFYDDVFNEPTKKARYYRQKSPNGVDYDILSDTVRHDKNKHALSKEEWQEVNANIDDIESSVLSARKGFYGIPVLIKLDVNGKKYGLTIEHNPSNGRNFITTAFTDSEKAIDKWISDEVKKKERQEMSSDPTSSMDEIQSVAHLGNSLPDIISNLDNNVNRAFYQGGVNENIYKATNSNEEPIANPANFNVFIEGSRVTDNDEPVSPSNPPKKIYCGDTRYFEEYEEQENAYEYDWGRAFYLSDNYDDILTNYQSGGVDLKNRIDREAEQYAEDNDISYDEAREKVRQKYEQEDIVREFYLSIKEPVIIGGDKETFFDYTEEYDEETDEYGEPQGKLLDLIYGIENYLADLGAEHYTQAITGRLYEEAIESGGGLSASQVEDIVRDTEEATILVDYESGPGEMLSSVFGSIGFDGIIDHRAGTKFRNMNMDPDTTHYIVFNSEQAKSVDNKGEWGVRNRNFYNQNSNNLQAPRGAYQNSIIYLFENADASTVIHELGHFFLDDMQKFADNETTKAQLEAIYKYVGSADGNLTVEQHEYFANSFELYLLEGRAPNKTLEKVFWNFRKWISRIWSEIKRLSGINLTPEIRKVFDEMLGGRGLDFAMQMSGARMAEALESGTIPPNVIAKAIELLETGKMSRADMDDLIARMKNGDLKRKDFNQELKKFENSNVKHNERLNPFDKVKYKDILSKGNFSKKDVLEKINRLLKWTEPRSQNGKLVGRFSNLKMNQEFDHIRELMNMEKAQAKEKLDENIKLINAMIRGEETGDMDRLVFDNKILTIRLNKANASLLLDVYNAISDSYNMGRLTTAVTGEARRARKNRLVNEAVHVLTADGDVDWRRERGKFKQFVNQLGTSQMSWQGILDILSMNDKTSKTGQSLLSQNLDVFEAQQKEAEGLAEDGEKASRFMEKKLKGVGNAAISVSRYVNSKLDEKFTIQWGANKKTFTKDQLLDIYMKSKDDETRKMMAEDPILQYNERFLSEVNEILTAEDRAIAEALFEFYDDNYAKINAFYEEKYGTSLGKRAFYSPRSMDRGGVNVDSGDLTSYAGFSGVKERKAKAGAVKIKGAFQVLQDYIVNSNHWIAWSDKLIDINAVMGDVEVKNIIRNLFGEGMEKRIGYEVSRMASNDKFQSKFGYGKLFNKIRSNYAIAALAAKPSLMIKQLTSFPAYWEHMSTAEFMSGLADFTVHMKEAVETLGNTTLMKTRDVNIIKDFEELSKSELFKKNANKVKLRELLMANIKLGDRGAIYMGGWALYKAELKKNLAKGMSEEKAKALALEKFERVTDETQQSGRLSQQSYWQSNPFLRAFTMFQSSQNQYLRKEINAIRGLATGRMDKKQALKTLFIFHVLLPCFFQYASDGFDWDEKAQLRAALLGSLNGIFILNGILERGLDYALGTADAWKATSTALRDVIPFWGSGEDLAKFFINLAEGDIDLEDYVEVVRAFGKPVGELTGIPVKYPLDVIQNFGEYAEEGEVKKEVLLWLGWSPYALRDKEED